MKVQEILAKSSGIRLVNHSKNVAFLSKYIAEKYLGVRDETLINVIYVSGLLHDIGKGYSDFQTYLKTEKKKKHKFRHNEIGGAFIRQYLNVNGIDKLNLLSHDSDLLQLFVSAVYWHHGITNRMGDNYFEEVLDDITSKDIEILKEILVGFVGENGVLDEPRSGMNKTPNYFIVDGVNENTFNSKLGVIRSCLISADRIVSSIEDDIGDFKLNNDNVESLLGKILEDKILKPKDYNLTEENYQQIDIERLNKQLEIVEETGKTTITNAPAGFGKTMIGILWGIRNNKKIIWVLPRNEVARSIYKSVLEDLNILGLDMKVELYLTGNTIERNYESTQEFSSDLIITNIDNFLVTSYSDKLSDRLFLVNSANVIFDEYHEFVSTDAYFAAFINIMRSRNNFTVGETLLLSATPFNIQGYWETKENKTTILPKENEHYPAIHDYTYNIEVIDKYVHKEEPNELTALNSIFESQLMKKNSPNSMLMHSGFSDEKIRENMDKLLRDFSKHNKDEKTYSLIGALMVRASLDISFKNLTCSITSPQDDIQKIGRCNRFGENEDNSTIRFIKLPDSNGKMETSPNENAVIRMLYDLALSNKWYDVLKQYNNNKLTLNQFYEIFNEFNVENENNISKLIRNKYRESLSSLSRNAYPFKMMKTQKSDIITAGGNKLRSSGNEVFYVVRSYEDPEKFVGVFNEQVRGDWGEFFSEGANAMNRMVKTMKHIMEGENEMELDYSELLGMKKRLNLDIIRRYARKSNTPYIRYDVKYHPVFGLVRDSHENRLLSL